MRIRMSYGLIQCGVNILVRYRLQNAVDVVFGEHASIEALLLSLLDRRIGSVDFSNDSLHILGFLNRCDWDCAIRHIPNGATISSFSKPYRMNDTAIEWDRYNLFQRAIFWCALHLNIVFPVILLIVSIIMLINCRLAYQLLDEEKKVWMLCSCECRKRRRNRAS